MPAGSDRPTGSSAPPLPVRFRPLGTGVASVAFGAMLVVVVVVVWLTLPARVQDSFTIPQRATVVLMMLMAAGVGYAISRCRIDADAEGLTVVNGFRTYRFAWGEVVGVTFHAGSPWAVLDLSDGSTRSAMGIQGSDGGRARRQVRQLRALLDEHSAAEPPRR